MIYAISEPDPASSVSAISKVPEASVTTAKASGKLAAVAHCLCMVRIALKEVLIRAK